MSVNPESELHLMRMKKKKIQELMVTPEMTEEIEGGDFFDDDNLMHTEEQLVEGVQILSHRTPENHTSGNVLHGSSEVMNYDYNQSNMAEQGYPTNSQMHGFHNSRPNPNGQSQGYSGVNHNFMMNNQQPRY
jgi:hypothetical protein